MVRAAPERGQSTPPLEWCERRLLGRIHRLTLDLLREQIRPVTRDVFWRFLTEHQCVLADTGRLSTTGVLGTLEQLQGYDLPATAWENDILSIRVRDYEPSWLDDLLLSGTFVWGRLRPPRTGDREESNARGMTRAVRLSFVAREDLGWLLPSDREASGPLTDDARRLLEVLHDRGALFTQDLRAMTGLLASQVE